MWVVGVHDGCKHLPSTTGLLIVRGEGGVRWVGEIGGWRPTSPPCCWWSEVKCQLVEGEAARRSVGAGKTWELYYSAVQSVLCADCQPSAQARPQTAHWTTVYGVVRLSQGWLEVEVLPVAACNNRKWAAAAKNNLNVWHTGDTETPQQQSSSTRHHGVTTLTMIQCDTMWYNVIQWYIIEIYSYYQSVKFSEILSKI